MTAFIVDSSVALKWVVPERGSVEALMLRQKGKLSAPELLMAECANAFWKKVVRSEISAEEAVLAARVLEQADIELVSMRSLVEASTALAITLGHPAYDCAYVALAAERDCLLVTADERLIMTVRKGSDARIASRVISLSEIAEMR